MNLLNKLNEKTKEQENYFENMTDQEKIELLAVMCEFCNPRISRGLFVRFFRSEYALHNDDDLEIAKQLFADQGVNLKTRRIVLNGVEKLYMLRSRCFLKQTQKFNKIKSLMKQIDKKNNEIAKRENEEKWWDLQSKLSSIRQDLYQQTTK